MAAFKGVDRSSGIATQGCQAMACESHNLAGYFVYLAFFCVCIMVG